MLQLLITSADLDLEQSKRMLQLITSADLDLEPILTYVTADYIS